MGQPRRVHRVSRTVRGQPSDSDPLQHHGPPHRSGRRSAGTSRPTPAHSRPLTSWWQRGSTESGGYRTGSAGPGSSDPSCTSPIYRTPADLSGQHVLLAGAGNSGVDIAAHLVDAGVASLWLSVRTPPNIVPAEIHRVPLQAVALRGQTVAGTVPRRHCQTRQPVRLRRSPSFRASELRPTVRTGGCVRRASPSPSTKDSSLALKLAGCTPSPRSIISTGPTSYLSDGTRLQPDTLLAATGYRTGLETMVGHLGVLDERGRPRRRRHRTSPMPGMHFIGFHPAIEGNLRQHPIEARRIARDIGHRHRHGSRT